MRRAARRRDRSIIVCSPCPKPGPIFLCAWQPRWFVALLLGLFLLFTPVLSPPTTVFAQNDATATILEPPKTGAQAVYAVDVTIGQPLYESTPMQQRSPASLTKMATVLVVIQVVDLDEKVEIIDSDIASEDESRVGFAPGDVVTVKQLRMAWSSAFR